MNSSNADLDEAYALISKLEEVRIVMNKLLGPGGVINERERVKFFKNSSNEPVQELNQT